MNRRIFLTGIGFVIVLARLPGMRSGIEINLKTIIESLARNTALVGEKLVVEKGNRVVTATVFCGDILSLPDGREFEVLA